MHLGRRHHMNDFNSGEFNRHCYRPKTHRKVASTAKMAHKGEVCDTNAIPNYHQPDRIIERSHINVCRNEGSLRVGLVWSSRGSSIELQIRTYFIDIRAWGTFPKELKIVSWRLELAAIQLTQEMVISLFNDVEFMEKALTQLTEAKKYFPCRVACQITIAADSLAAVKFSTRVSGTLVIKTHRHHVEPHCGMATREIMETLLISAVTDKLRVCQQKPASLPKQLFMAFATNAPERTVRFRENDPKDAANYESEVRSDEFTQRVMQIDEKNPPSTRKPSIYRQRMRIMALAETRSNKEENAFGQTWSASNW